MEFLYQVTSLQLDGYLQLLIIRTGNDNAPLSGTDGKNQSILTMYQQTAGNPEPKQTLTDMGLNKYGTIVKKPTSLTDNSTFHRKYDLVYQRVFL